MRNKISRVAVHGTLVLLSGRADIPPTTTHAQETFTGRSGALVHWSSRIRTEMSTHDVYDFADDNAGDNDGGAQQVHTSRSNPNTSADHQISSGSAQGEIPEKGRQTAWQLHRNANLNDSALKCIEE